MRAALLAFLLIQSVAGFAQNSFTDQLTKHRQTYKNELLTTAGGPLAPDDLAYLRFYDPDSAYRVTATVALIPNAEPFEMPTYNGKTKPHVAYALVSFTLGRKPQQLTIYRSLNLMRIPNYRDYLFLPFTDATSGQTTYGGGRYMDLRLGDIKNGQITLDFNRAYNPYCAFQPGYACPIPPAGNALSVAIEAGEKDYAKPH